MTTRPTAPHLIRAPAQPALAALGIELHTRPVPAHAELARLLSQPDLPVAGRDRIVSLLADVIRPWASPYGYTARDLVVLHPDTPGLEDLLDRFKRPHIHTDDEVRYVVDGEGVFGFFDADGHEHVVTVTPGDFVRIPARTEHRFSLTPLGRIKAVRLFTDPAGWAAIYTNRQATELAGAI